MSNTHRDNVNDDKTKLEGHTDNTRKLSDIEKRQAEENKRNNEKNS